MSHKGNRVGACFPFFHYLCTMRLFEKTLTIIFFTLLVHGCSEPVPVPDARLTVVDSLFIIEEDSTATALLEAVNPDSLSSTDYPLYCVLMLQAQDRNDRPMADTIVASAIAHYKHHDEDSYHAGLAWYYMGHVARKTDYVAAILDYETATDFFRKAGNSRYEYLSLNYIFHTCWLAGDINSQHTVLFEVLKAAEKTGNRRYLYVTLTAMGNSFLEKGEYDSAREYEMKALDVIGDGNPTSKAYAFERIAMSYIYQNDYQRASSFMDSLRTCRNVVKNMSCSVFRLLSAAISMENGKALTAKAYLDSLVVGKSNYALMAAQNRLYTEVYYMLGIPDSATIRKNEWRKVEIERGRVAEAFQNELKKRKTEQEQEDNAQKQKWISLSLSLFASAIVALVVVSVVLIYKKRSKEREAEEASEKLRSMEERSQIDAMAKREVELRTGLLNVLVCCKNSSESKTAVDVHNYLQKTFGGDFFKEMNLRYGLKEETVMMCTMLALGLKHETVSSVLIKSKDWSKATLSRIKSKNSTILEDIKGYILSVNNQIIK